MGLAQFPDTAFAVGRDQKLGGVRQIYGRALFINVREQPLLKEQKISGKKGETYLKRLEADSVRN